MSYPHAPGEQPPVTVARHDYHHIGPDQKPFLHVVEHTIEAASCALAKRILYQSDADQVRVTVHEGGKVDNDSQIVDERDERIGETSGKRTKTISTYIVLNKPLPPGRQQTIEYEVALDYSTPPKADRRLHVGSVTLKSLETTIIFDPEKIPGKVLWGEWDKYAKDTIDFNSIEEHSIEPLPKDPKNRLHVHKAIQKVPAGTILGFFWEW